MRYLSSKRDYENMIREAKKCSWLKFVSESPLWGTPYAISMGRIKSKLILSTVSDSSGVFTTNSSDTVNQILDSLLPNDDINSDNYN